MHTFRVNNHKCIFQNIGNTQKTTDIRMHAWLTSDAHCLSQLYLVYIPTYTYTYQLSLKLLQTSGYICGSQVMHTVRVQYPMCIFHIHTPHNTRTTIAIRMHRWFTSDAHSSSRQSQVNISTCTYQLILDSYIQQHAWMVHKWYALFESAIPMVYSHSTHNIILTTWQV